MREVYCLPREDCAKSCPLAGALNEQITDLREHQITFLDEQKKIPTARQQGDMRVMDYVKELGADVLALTRHRTDVLASCRKGPKTGKRFWLFGEEVVRCGSSLARQFDRSDRTKPLPQDRRVHVGRLRLR